MSDLVPTFKMELNLCDEEKKVALKASPHFVAESLSHKISVALIEELLEKGGYGNFHTHDEQIAEIVSALQDALEQIESEEDIKDFTVETDAIAEAIDASGTIDVAGDKLKATLNIVAAQGGQHLTMADVENLLNESNVTFGVDNEKIQSLLNEAQQAEGGATCSAVIAEAKLPVKGEDSKFIPLVETASERILKPRLKEDGTVDMLDLGDMPTVKLGAPLMRKELPTPGEAGTNVLSETIEPEAGKDLAFKPGPGAKISEEDELLLVSTLSGQPNLINQGMKVDNAVQVKAVDVSTGHMTLDANLMVKGDIGEGMRVRCEGDITVGGVIESADVKAKGNIIIGKGILGRTAISNQNHELTVSVEAKGSISAMFASYANLKAEGDIVIAEQLLHCDVSSKKTVVVGNKKTVGAQIVGGHTVAYERIETDVLGASAGVLTHLDLSGSYNEKHLEVVQARTLLEEKEKVLDNIRDAYSRFMNFPMTEERQQHLTKIKNTLTFLEKEIANLEQQTEDLIDEADKLCHGLKVIAKRKIYPNVSLSIGHARYKSLRQQEAGELYFEADEIHYNSRNID